MVDQQNGSLSSCRAVYMISSWRFSPWLGSRLAAYLKIIALREVLS